MFALEVCLAPIQCAYGSGRAPTSSNETQQTAQILSVRKVLRNQYFVSRYPQIHYYMTRLRFLTKSRMYLQEYRWELGASEARAPASGSCQTSEIPFGFVIGTGQARFGRTGVSGSVARVSRRGLGYTSRRTRGATLAVVRFRQHEHQRPTLVLLASRWKPEEHKNGSVCKTAADASKPEAFLAGVEITKPLQQTGRFRVSFRKTARQQAIRSGFSPEEENTACIQTDRNHGCGLAHLSALGWYQLAEMGEHQLTIRDYLRHSNLHVTNKYLQATSKTKRLAQDKLVDAISPTGILPKTNLIQ